MLAPGVVDYQVTFPFTYADIVSVFINAAGGSCLMETNSGSAPDDSVLLLQNKPLIWNNESYFGTPFTADVTDLFLSNPGSTVTTFDGATQAPHRGD